MQCYFPLPDQAKLILTWGEETVNQVQCYIEGQLKNVVIIVRISDSEANKKRNTQIIHHPGLHWLSHLVSHLSDQELIIKNTIKCWDAKSKRK